MKKKIYDDNEEEDIDAITLRWCQDVSDVEEEEPSGAIPWTARIEEDRSSSKLEDKYTYSVLEVFIRQPGTRVVELVGPIPSTRLIGRCRRHRSSSGTVVGAKRTTGDWLHRSQ